MNDQKLWDLLGQARHPVAPPFFAAKVMRQIETRHTPRPVWFADLLRWLAPSAIAALLLVAVLPRQPVAPTFTSELTTLDLVEMLSPEDYQTLTSAGWPFNSGFLSAGL
jgi:hypothetical protein